MEKAKYYIGLDIGGTKCAVCLGKRRGEEMQIALRESFPTAGKTYGEILAIYAEKITSLTKEYPVESIGIVCGGPLDSERGIIQSPPNLPGWDNVEIVEYFHSRFHLPTFLENDASAGALAEHKFGAGKGYPNVVFMTFGTGLGSGLVFGGKLYVGANGNAGEIGHIRLEEEGPVGYNKAGSAEGFCSGNGIRNLAILRAKEQGVPLGEEITAKEIFARAREGEPFSLSIVKESAEKFARVCSIWVDLFNPNVIVVGGVFMRNYDLFMPIMQPIMERECLPCALEVCKVVPAKLDENIGDYASLAIALRSEE